MKKLQLFGICLLILITGINNAVAQQQGGSSNYFDLIEQQDTYYDSLLNVLGPDSMQGTGYKQYIRWRAFVSMRLDDDGTLDNYMNAVNGYYNGAQGTTGYNWSYFGPKGLTENIDWSFGKGWIYSIHVNEDNHNVIHAGAHNSGLYKTINGGKSWRCITDNMPEITGVKGLAIPDDDTATIYIATVANVGSYFNGLFKTSNSGQTWIKLDLLYNGNDLYPDNNWRKYPKKIIIHPANSNIIFFLANHYIAKSTDAGQNWTVNHFSDFEYPGEEFEDIIFDSDDPDIMYVSGHVVLKSVDGGDTWTEDITLDITNNPANLKICTMYSSDNYPGKIWFLATFRQNSYPKVVRYDSDNNEYETL